MSIQSEIKKGGWKNPQALLLHKEENYKITILMGNGKVKRAEWHDSLNWIKTDRDRDTIIAWKDGWTKTKLEKLVDWFRLFLVIVRFSFTNTKKGK